MRILFLLLLVGLCLVSAKYIPHESSATNLVLHRVRRSDSEDADSNTASVERDDDSSNDNDNNDDDDNDSSETKVTEEQSKLREQEEKKKQKLLERLEKERQKEIEENRKLEEKLLKDQRKQQEKQEKEERKLQQRIEKERRKVEEQKRKMEEKEEKERRKRQEKLKKQLEDIQKEQAESAEDSYLETEEEDSVEIEDIWKAHVYNKYGLSITSTKLERQAALQQYLREEMGIDANSTKSERRQAILKLIQTKLQNDSATVDAFRNLLLSHVNAAQIQKMRSNLENDLEELNNKTELLNNISLPWVTVAQQNIEEKRTFLQAIAQFLSNIVPNWFTGPQGSNNTIQINSSNDSSFSNTNAASGINAVNVALPGGLGQPSVTASESDLPTGIYSQNNNGVNVDINDLSNNGPSSTGSVTSNGVPQSASEHTLNNLSQPELSASTEPLLDITAGLQHINGLSSNAPTSTNTELSNSVQPAVSGNNVAVDQNNANGVSTNVNVAANSQSPNVAIPEQTLNNPSQFNESINSGLSVVVSQSNLPTDNSQNNSGSTGTVNGLATIGASLTGSVSSNDVSQSGSEQSLNNPSQPELPAITGPAFDIAAYEQNDNGVTSNATTSLNFDASNVATQTDLAQPSINPVQAATISDIVSLNNNVNIDENNANGLSGNVHVLANLASSNVPLATGSEQTSSNTLQTSGSVENGSLNNVVTGQLGENGESSNAVISGNTETSGFANSGGSEQSAGNPADPNVSAVVDHGSPTNEPAFGQSVGSVLSNDVAVPSNTESSNVALTSSLDAFSNNLSDLTSTISTVVAQESSSNPSQPPIVTDILKNNIAVSHPEVNLLTDSISTSVNSDSLKETQTDLNVLPNVVAVSVKTQSINTDTPATAEQSSSNPSTPNAAENNVLNDSGVNKQNNILVETILPVVPSSVAPNANFTRDIEKTGQVDSTVLDATVISTSSIPDAVIKNNVAEGESNGFTIGSIQTDSQGNSAPVQSKDITTGTVDLTVSNEPAPIETIDTSLTNIAPVINSDTAATDSVPITNPVILSEESNTNHNITSVNSDSISSSDSHVTSNGNQENILVADVISISDAVNTPNEVNLVSTRGSSNPGNAENFPTESTGEVSNINTLDSSITVGTLQTVKEASSGIGNDNTVSEPGNSAIISDSVFLTTTIESSPVDVPENVPPSVDNVVNYVTSTSFSSATETSLSNKGSADGSAVILSDVGTLNAEGNSNTDNVTESTVVVTSSVSTASEPITLSPIANDVNIIPQSSSVDVGPTTGAIVENVNIEDQTVASGNEQVVKTIDNVTPIELKSEQDTNIVQESVNTPVASATIPSDIASVQTDIPTDITVPIEPGASIVDIKTQ